MIKTILTIAAFVTVALACSKPVKKISTVDTHLEIIATNSMVNLSNGQEIISGIRCQAPNLCYSFSHFVVSEVSARQFVIRAKATYPNPMQESIACAMALYTIDTTLKIPATTKGAYLLRFYNANQLFKIDTIHVD